MSYRRFKLPETGHSPATVATVATVLASNPASFASVATVASGLTDGDTSDPSVANVANQKPAPVDLDTWQAHFEERAAIREFNGGFDRRDAEALALKDTTAVLGPRPGEVNGACIEWTHD
jgi:hypothetical protein